ncbi:hypothetical protein HNP24_003578 [Chryseobacterium sediminis]|uniref:Uncharacterized protein n=1 Tax=Chryseobacterium sediminis TaxID=1679494 RepID=A0ABR6Q3P8_9FLAO|nr:hypothetical protein [Chryseobacterium sediminis]
MSLKILIKKNLKLYSLENTFQKISSHYKSILIENKNYRNKLLVPEK